MKVATSGSRSQCGSSAGSPPGGPAARGLAVTSGSGSGEGSGSDSGEGSGSGSGGGEGSGSGGGEPEQKCEPAFVCGVCGAVVFDLPRVQKNVN